MPDVLPIVVFNHGEARPGLLCYPLRITPQGQCDLMYYGARCKRGVGGSRALSTHLGIYAQTRFGLAVRGGAA
jgi:hypothetical protein